MAAVFASVCGVRVGLLGGGDLLDGAELLVEVVERLGLGAVRLHVRRPVAHEELLRENNRK